MIILNLVTKAYAAFTPVDLKDQYGFGGINSLGEVLSSLMGPAFSIAGVAVLIYFLIGAFRWIISGGDKESISKAKNMITHAIIGFILLVLLFTIVNFVFEFIGLKGFKIF